METQTSPNSSAPWLSAPVAIIIAGAIIGISLIVALRQPAGTGTGPVAPQGKKVDVKDVKIDGSPYIGNLNAPVTLVAWEDYQCPFCHRFEAEVLPTLIKTYVDTGKVKIVFKDYEFLGPNSLVMGEYGRAVWELYPTKFLAWRTAVMKNQTGENNMTPTENEAYLVKMSSSIPGIDAQKVKALVATKKTQYDALIGADQAEGSGFGIQGTPGFITGKVSIDGAQPLASFTAALDPQL